MMIDLSTLNENQLEAVNWDDGPLLVLAGPGSGKTRVLTLRIARLVENTPEKHFKILGLTFTDKAAMEMRERIADLVPNADKRTLLTTFHSFAANLLRQHGHHVRLKPDFTILARDADRLSLLDDAMKKAGAGNFEWTSEKLLPLVSRLTETDVSPEDARDVLERGSFDDPETLASIYKLYRELMIEKNALDFAGLITETLGLLKTHSGIRKQIHRVYPYICVDEFQDTNLSQYKILRNLINENTKNVFVVADDDQIIYQWNGASPERLKEIQNDFDMKSIHLPENYRCPADVVKLANNLIVHNPDRHADKGALKAHKNSSETRAVTLKQFERFPDEASWIAEEMAARTPEERAKCAVLARTKKLLEQIVEARDDQGVDGYLAARKNEFESPSLQWLHSILRLANSRSDREHLQRLCKAFFTLEGIDLDIHDIITHADTADGDYVRSWAAAARGREQLSAAARNLVETSVVPILLGRLDFRHFQDDAFKWLDDLSASRPDAEDGFDGYPEEKETWCQLVNDISDQHGKSEMTLHLLLQEIDLRSKSPAPSKEAVPCLTIHGSKGMEFDHVYLAGMVEDHLPNWMALKKGDDSREMREERRNCFVAITRAQETLTLTYSEHLHGRPKKPSRFLFEMGLLERDGISKDEPWGKIDGERIEQTELVAHVMS